MDRHDLMRAADTAMYSAKSQDRNRALFHTPQLAAIAVERMNLEQGLRQAIEISAFLIHYQPSFASRTTPWWVWKPYCVGPVPRKA